MFLKNYTSKVPKSETVANIQKLLIRIGVGQIGMDYGADGQVAGITFALPPEPGKRPVAVKLPVDVEGCHEAFWMDYAGGDRLSTDGQEVWSDRGSKRKKRREFRDQAERTAWKLMQDWLEVQISMIQMKQADFIEVFLPYVWDGRQSFYNRLKGGGFAALMPPKE